MDWGSGEYLRMTRTSVTFIVIQDHSCLILWIDLTNDLPSNKLQTNETIESVAM